MEIGIQMVYPESWKAVKQDNSFVWVRIADEQDDSRLTLFTLFHDVDTPVSERLDEAASLFVEQEVEEGLEPEAELLGPVTLDDGSPASRADINHPGENGTILHRVQVAQHSSFTYAAILATRLDTLPVWEEAFDTMLASLRTFSPAIYSVGHERAFIMPLGEPNTMDPALVRETTSHFFVNHVFSGLVRFDANLGETPDLAEGWEVDETGTVYTFTLREGITFHDGQPITAEDFKYSIERASDPELHSDTVPLYLGDIGGMHEKPGGEAVNREELHYDVLEGNAALANELLPPGLPGYNHALSSITYDPERARDLLAGPQCADGLPEINFTAVSYDGEPSSLVQFMVDSRKENLGVEVQVHLVDADAYYYNLEAVGGHLYTYDWVADYPDPENFLDLLGHESRYINEEFDALEERARVEGDQDVRLALYQEAEQLLKDDAGIIPLYHVRDYVLIRPHVEGFRVLPVGQPDLTGIQLYPFEE